MLIFSQFVSMLKLMAAALDEDKIRYEYLDGSTIDLPAAAADRSGRRRATETLRQRLQAFVTAAAGATPPSTVDR